MLLLLLLLLSILSCFPPWLSYSSNAFLAAILACFFVFLFFLRFFARLRSRHSSFLSLLSWCSMRAPIIFICRIIIRFIISLVVESSGRVVPLSLNNLHSLMIAPETLVQSLFLLFEFLDFWDKEVDNALPLMILEALLVEALQLSRLEGPRKGGQLAGACGSPPNAGAALSKEAAGSSDGGGETRQSRNRSGKNNVANQIIGSNTFSLLLLGRSPFAALLARLLAQLLGQLPSPCSSSSSSLTSEFSAKLKLRLFLSSMNDAPIIPELVFSKICRLMAMQQKIQSLIAQASPLASSRNCTEPCASASSNQPYHEDLNHCSLPG
jgi:hypothetical protein